MRALFAFAVLALLLALPAAAGEEEDEVRLEILRLRGRVQVLLDRVEELERTLDLIDGGGDAGHEGWVAWGGHRIPPRRDYDHPYRIRKIRGGFEVDRLVVVPQGVGGDCLKDASLKVSLRVRHDGAPVPGEARFTLSFRHPRGRSPGGLKASAALKRFSVYAKDEVLAEGDTQGTMSTAESGGMRHFVQTSFNLDLDAFLGVLGHDEVTLAFRPLGDPEDCARLRLAGAALEALRDAASRLAGIADASSERAPADVRKPGPQDVKGLPELTGCAFPRRRTRSGLSEHGGSTKTERGVARALEWLAAHQSPDGLWEAAGFWRWAQGKPVTKGLDGLGRREYDVGVTGLALLAFLGAGYTHLDMHTYGSVVARGLAYLRTVQDQDGCVGPRNTKHYIYAHAAAAQAVVEAYAMTKDEKLWAVAQAAVDFTCKARNPYFAWRYGVMPGDNDTSVTGWMGSVLHVATLCNESTKKTGVGRELRVDPEAPEGLLAWVQKMTDPDYGRTGYLQRGGFPARPQVLLDRFPGDKTESMTAVGLWLRLGFGQRPKGNEIIAKGAELCRKTPPLWNPMDGSIDLYYWYYGTLALHQVGGPPWLEWNRAMQAAMLRNQREDTAPETYRGSWDPIGPWGPDGGRVYSTALGALMLETYYRFDRIFD